MPYTILLMDADETLLDFRRSEGFALETALERHGVAMTPAVHERYHEINRVLWQRLERGEIERKRLKVQRFEELFAELGVTHLNAAAFNAEYMNILGTKGVMLDGALDLLADLSKTYAIYIITNGSASVQHRRLADSGMLPFVREVFISEEVGADKPSLAYFEHVLQAIGNPDKRDLLVVGDSLTSDIRGGINAGIDTCWYAPDGGDAPEDLAPTVTVRSYEELRQFLQNA